MLYLLSTALVIASRKFLPSMAQRTMLDIGLFNHISIENQASKVEGVEKRILY